MLGAALIFIVTSLFLNVTLSKEEEEVQYSSLLLLNFLVFYFFFHSSPEGLTQILPGLISVLLVYVSFLINKRGQKKSGKLGD